MSELQSKIHKKDHGLSQHIDHYDEDEQQERQVPKGGRIGQLRRSHSDLRSSGELRMGLDNEASNQLRFESDRRDKEEAVCFSVHRSP